VTNAEKFYDAVMRLPVVAFGLFFLVRAIAQHHARSTEAGDGGAVWTHPASALSGRRRIDKNHILAEIIHL